MDNFSSQCQEITCIKRFFTFFTPESNIKEIVPKILMKTYIRDLQNDIIKPSENDGLVGVVDSGTDKVLISDTTFKSFIPPQDRKITTKLSQICGCELCIIPKDI